MSYGHLRRSDEFWRPGFEQPVVLWVPSIPLSGMAFYTGDRLPRWKGDVFVGGLRTGEIPGTGHLERILFNQKMEERRRESLLVGLRQRIRDGRQGPDGLRYILTDHNTDGSRGHERSPRLGHHRRWTFPVSIGAGAFVLRLVRQGGTTPVDEAPAVVFEVTAR